jgi:hypothetical protein
MDHEKWESTWPEYVTNYSAVRKTENEIESHKHNGSGFFYFQHSDSVLCRMGG